MRCWLCGETSVPDSVYGVEGFSRCGACGFLFAAQRSSDELHELYTDDYFENYPGGESYDSDDAQRRYEARDRVRWVASVVPGGRLLEVGSANGTFLDVVAGAGFEVHGIEPAPGPAAQARERLGLDVQTGFIETATLPDNVDAICAWHVLEHLPEPVEAMQRLRSVLRPEGRLFLEIPNIESTRARRLGTGWFHLDPDNHVAFYTVANLRALLRRTGFAVEQVFTVSGHSLLRPRVALEPARLVVRLQDTLAERALQGRRHPTKHEMLRVVARPV